jgi:putative ABC transport system permease protein
MGPMDWRKYAARPHFSYGDLAAILEQPDIVAASTADYREGQKIATDRAETRSTVEVVGATSMWAETTSVPVVQGRFFTDADDPEARGVAVLGPDVVDVLFPDQDPVGQEIRIRGRTMQVIGVLQRRGSFMGMVSLDNLVVVPFQTFSRVFGNVEVEDIAVQARDSSVFQKAQDEVISLMRRRRGVPPNEENNFEITTNESNTKQFNQFSLIISAAGFGICVLSLVVGGIGILNIMLVSVAERTREIGIRKALGAKRRRVLAQFATEAVVLALVGGVLGLLLGAGASALVRWMLALPTEVPAWAVALALGMSSGVGLLFGIYPAARAARLDPVEAMRSE